MRFALHVLSNKIGNCSVETEVLTDLDSIPLTLSHHVARIITV